MDGVMCSDHQRDRPSKVCVSGARVDKERGPGRKGVGVGGRHFGEHNIVIVSKI